MFSTSLIKILRHKKVRGNKSKNTVIFNGSFRGLGLPLGLNENLFGQNTAKFFSIFNFFLTLNFSLQSEMRRKLQQSMDSVCSNHLTRFVNLQASLIPQLKELASRWQTASISLHQRSRSSITTG